MIGSWKLSVKLSRGSTPVSFFPEVHEERIKSCRHLTAIPPYTGSSGLSSLHNAGAALGRAMSTLAVQERHLWLNLAKMWNAQKCAFSTLISQVGLLATPLKTLHSDSSRLKKCRAAVAWFRFYPCTPKSAVTNCSSPGMGVTGLLLGLPSNIKSCLQKFFSSGCPCLLASSQKSFKVQGSFIHHILNYTQYN